MFRVLTRHPEGICFPNVPSRQLQHLLSKGHDAALWQLLDEADYTEHTYRREVLRDIAEAPRRRVRPAAS